MMRLTFTYPRVGNGNFKQENKMKKIEKHNLELRRKRARSTVSVPHFPLVIRTKPTAHKQYCLVCRNEIKKGERQIRLPHGVWAIASEGRSATAVFDKFVGSRHAKYYTRHIYLHPDCFGCLINKMMLKADLPNLQVNLTCDVCRNRFNCWTGNMDEGDLPAYIPSRPCGRV